MNHTAKEESSLGLIGGVWKRGACNVQIEQWSPFWIEVSVACLEKFIPFTTIALSFPLHGCHVLLSITLFRCYIIVQNPNALNPQSGCRLKLFMRHRLRAWRPLKEAFQHIHQSCPHLRLKAPKQLRIDNRTHRHHHFLCFLVQLAPERWRRRMQLPAGFVLKKPQLQWSWLELRHWQRLQQQKTPQRLNPRLPRQRERG